MSEPFDRRLALENLNQAWELYRQMAEKVLYASNRWGRDSSQHKAAIRCLADASKIIQAKHDAWLEAVEQNSPPSSSERSEEEEGGVTPIQENPA